MSRSIIDEKAAMEKWQQVTFSNRYMFRLVMEEEQLCKRTLEVVLGIRISKLVYLEQEKSYEGNFSSKGIRLDVYIEAEDGVAYDLELQASDEDGIALGKRTRYYQSLIDVNVLKKGQPYNELKKSIIIFICKYDPFGKNLLRYTFSNLCKENPSISLNDDSSKLFINTKGLVGEESRELHNFIEYVNSGVASDSFTEALAEAVARQHSDKMKAVKFMYFEQYVMEAEYRGALKQKAIYEKQLEEERKKAEAAENDAQAAKKKAEAAENDAQVAKQKAEAAKNDAEAAEKNILQGIKNLRAKLNCSSEEAMQILGLSEELQAKYIKLL